SNSSAGKARRWTCPATTTACSPRRARSASRSRHYERAPRLRRGLRPASPGTARRPTGHPAGPPIVTTCRAMKSMIIGDVAEEVGGVEGALLLLRRERNAALPAHQTHAQPG